MHEINQQMNKSNAGSNKISIRNDLAKSGMILSDESGRAIHEMGNVELIELTQTSETTTQCPSCLKYVFDGKTMRQCEKLLRPNIVRWTESGKHAKHREEASYYRAAPIISRRKKCCTDPWQQDHHRNQRRIKCNLLKKGKLRFGIGGRMTKAFEHGN